MKHEQLGWHPLYISTYGSVVSVHQVNLVLRLAHAQSTLAHSCISRCSLRRKCCCGSFLDRSLHTSVTTHCSCSLRASLQMYPGVSTAWKAWNSPVRSLRLETKIGKHLAKYARFLASSWNTLETLQCRVCHHIIGIIICKILIWVVWKWATVTDRKGGAHPHLCVRVGKGLCWSVIKKPQYALPLPWSTHQGCLMALEIRAACLFFLLVWETVLHRMEDLFVFITSVCMWIHCAYKPEWE